jgi:hypothetical protein
MAPLHLSNYLTISTYLAILCWNLSIDILSIHTTKHNLNFDTFNLMKYPY